MLDAHTLSVYRAVMLKGLVDADVLARVTRLDAGQVRERLADAVRDGDLAVVRNRYRLSAPGEAKVIAALAQERDRADREWVGAEYERFLGVNADFKSVVTDWQIRPDGAVNDHADPDYDQRALDRLRAVHDRIAGILGAVAAAVPRLAVYEPRFADALERIESGDVRWLASPLIDSYHTVWFELHEDLLSLSGRERVREELASS